MQPEQIEPNSAILPSRYIEPTINAHSYYTQDADLLKGLEKLGLLPKIPGDREFLYCVIPADKVEFMQSNGTYLKKGGEPANLIFCCQYAIDGRLVQVNNPGIEISEYIRQNCDSDLRGNLTAKIAVLDGSQLMHNVGAEFSFKNPEAKLGALIALVTVHIPA